MDEPKPTESQIDAGAEALRQRLQGGKSLTSWAVLPNSRKKKWRDYASVVLIAACSARISMK